MTDNDLIIPDFDAEQAEHIAISLKKIDGVENALFILLDGYIDTYNSSFFQKQIAKVIDAGFIRLVFGCADLTYVSSTGIGSFTVFLKVLKPKGGEVVLLNLRPDVNEVFQLLGFSKFFIVLNSLDEALSHFQGGEAPKSGIFPKIFSCLVCSRKLKAAHAGRFRCSECKSILTLNEAGEVALG